MRNVMLIAALMAAGTLGGISDASAHTSTRAPIIHEIDHLRGQTNEIRGVLGREPIATDFAYRHNKSTDVRSEVLSQWQSRISRARTMPPHPSSVWARLAECESHGAWDYNGSVIYDGGLQFHPQTWSDYRLSGYPDFAWQATPAEQIRVATLVQREQGWRAWPVCSQRIGVR